MDVIWIVILKIRQYCSTEHDAVILSHVLFVEFWQEICSILNVLSWLNVPQVPSQNRDTPTAEIRGLNLSCFELCLILPAGSCTLRTMSSTVKSLKVSYNPVNEKNTFTNGDTVSGQVQLEVAKDFQIDFLLIKFKGKAEVKWTETDGEDFTTSLLKEKYFSIKHYFIQDKNLKGDDQQTLLTNQNGPRYSSVVAPGCHVYPFTFQIPFQPMPSSFSGSVGKIVYSLEARLKRSMKREQRDSTKINFVSKADFNSDPGLMTPQHESKDKKMKVFTSGTVAMDVNLEKTGFFQGEELQVLTYIQNNSSRKVKPKYCVYRKRSFFADGQRRVDTKDLLKEVGEPIPPSANKMVTRVITIPHDMEPSILNCSIIKVEHRLRVYLDVKYASDPEIKLPIVILPAVPGPGGEQNLPAPTYGFGAFANSDITGGTSFLQNPTASAPSDPPPSYGTYGMYPSFTDSRKF